jgi:hypothetical protein
MNEDGINGEKKISEKHGMLKISHRKIPMNEFRHLEIQASQKLKMVETYGERKPLKKLK